MITSYLVVFGSLSRMVKVRGARDKPLWIYKRLNNCAPPPPATDSDDALVISSLAWPAHKSTSSSTTKTSSLSGAGRGGSIIQWLIYPKRHIAAMMHLRPSPFDSAARALQDLKLSSLGELPRKSCNVLVTSVCGGHMEVSTTQSSSIWPVN